MAKQKMASLSSTTSPRKSIGLANLVDAAPPSTDMKTHIAKKEKQARNERLRIRRSKVDTETATQKDGDGVSAASPTTVLDVPDSLTTGEAQRTAGDMGDSQACDRVLVIDASLQLATDPFHEPTTPRGSAVAAVALFDAIANDEFFAVMASHSIELCGSDEDAQRIREDARASAAVQTVVNVNGFKDSTHGKSLLHQACKMADFQVIRCLLYNGASPMQQCVMGRTPFHDVISSGRRDQALVVLQTLFDYEPHGVALVDINGTHVVHLAAIHGCLDVIQWCARLAAQPVSPVAMSITSFSGRNVLHYAAYNGRLNVLEWLLLEDACGGPSITSLDVNGYSVLHYAAMGGHLDVCEWLVFHAPSRRNLNIVGTNSSGNTAFDLAKQPELRAFLEEISQVPEAPTEVECVGVDSCSMGIKWKFEPATDDPHMLEVLAPKWFELEYCKKPTGLRRASAMLSMLMLVPSNTANSAAVSASSYLLNWETLGVRLQADSNEHWLTGLEGDCEYLVRIRACNRNGCGEFSALSLSGDFKTSAINSGGSNGKKNSFLDLLAPSPTRGVEEMSFIGTLDFELLEARRLLRCSIVSPQDRRNRQEAADEGRFFGVVTLQVPLDSVDGSDQRRRTSLSRFRPGNDGKHPACVVDESRCLYRMRTDFATVQQDLILAGSLHAFRHPQFRLRTKLRVPDALDSELIIEVHHESPSAQSSMVGLVRVPLMEFVRGFPAKLQWLALDGECAHPEAGTCGQPHGELLVRSLFLADGISELPHPTNTDLRCTTAEELLDETVDTLSDSPVSSETSSTSTASLSASPASSGSSASPVLSPSNSSQASPPVQLHKYDEFGFRVLSARESSTRRTHEYFRLHQRCTAQQQESLWIQYHRETAGRAQSEKRGDQSRASLVHLLETPEREAAFYEPSEFRHSARLRRLVWDGIPPSSRRVLYLRMSGAEAKRRAAVKGYYQQQLKRAMSLKAVNGKTSTARQPSGSWKFDVARKQIQVDLQRTFAGNQSWINSVEGQEAMERVLLTYAVHNEHIGYCQSMSFIVARLLCLFRGTEEKKSQEARDRVRVEEDVFWVLAALCEDYFPRYYGKGMDGLHIDGLVLEALLQRRLPKVNRHFQVVLHNPPQMGLLLVTGWLLPVFCAVFPSETSFRLLDVLMYEGSSVVFALVLTLLRMAQPQMIYECKDYMQLFRLLKERDQRLHDTALLMEIALDEHELLEKEIMSLRKQCELQHTVSQRTHEQEDRDKRCKSGGSSTTIFF